MGSPEKSGFVRGDPTCAFCAGVLHGDDTMASIRLLSRAHGQRYFGVHLRCLQEVMRPEIAQLIDLSDVPSGLDHMLPLSSLELH